MLPGQAVYRQYYIHSGFSKIHPGIAKALLDKMELQRWSLSDRHIPLALFSSFVDIDEKSHIAVRLNVVRPAGQPATPVSLGRPAFPEILDGMSLADFVDSESWLLFDLIKVDNGWLRRSPPWDGDEGYEAVKAIVLSICGVNDPAERLCALAKRHAVSNFLRMKSCAMLSTLTSNIQSILVLANRGNLFCKSK